MCLAIVSMLSAGAVRGAGPSGAAVDFLARFARYWPATATNAMGRTKRKGGCASTTAAARGRGREWSADRARQGD